jgi:hypothetical protein
MTFDDIEDWHESIEKLVVFLRVRARRVPVASPCGTDIRRIAGGREPDAGGGPSKTRSEK